MIRRLLIATSVSALLATPALAERTRIELPLEPVAQPAAEQAAPAPSPEARATRQTGVAIGQRLAALGAVRDSGDRLELTVFAEQAKDPRVPSADPAELVDTLVETAGFLHQRTIVITAHAPAKVDPTRGLLRAQNRAQALRVSLEQRGVDSTRIRTTAAPPVGRGAGAVDVVVTFERPATPTAALTDAPAVATR